MLCLPGLTRNAADFDRLAKYLSSKKGGARKVIAMDLRGRGRSAHDRNWSNYNPIVEAGDVLSVLDAYGVHSVQVIGTSRGGIVTMVLAAMRPGILSKIVFNDIGPEVDARGLVRIKNYIEKASAPASLEQAADYLKRVAQAQFPEWGDEEWAYQARLIYEEVDGKLVRMHDPRLVKTLSTLNLDQPLPTMWPQFKGLTRIPLLLIRGATTDLLSTSCVEEMQRLHNGMEVIEVPAQGHAPDLGTAGLPQKIAGFLNRS